MRVLIVKSQFKDYQKGDRITDQNEIAQIKKRGLDVHTVETHHEEDAPATRKVAFPAPKADTEKK